MKIMYNECSIIYPMKKIKVFDYLSLFISNIVFHFIKYMVITNLYVLSYKVVVDYCRRTQ